MTDAIVVFITAGSANEARQIADHLVEDRLAGCVQVLPEIESVYTWKSQVQHEKEVLILAKTRTDKFAALEKSVRAIHSYETPEIIAVRVSDVSEPYRKWLSDSVGDGN
jgi:periplasmic divalent cation tolerance protein